MTDLKAISDLLINKGKVRGKPVGISLFRDTIPEAYQPIQDNAQRFLKSPSRN